MNFLRLKMTKYKSNTGDKLPVDLVCNLDSLVYVDMKESPTRLICKFEDDMNIYFVDDSTEVNKLLEAIGEK